MKSLRTSIPLLLMAFQAVMIVQARLGTYRYFFCWAPYDVLNEYRIHAELDGQSLDARQIKERYRIPAEGINPRSIYQVLDAIEYVERHDHRDSVARVRVEYRINGVAAPAWEFP